MQSESPEKAKNVAWNNCTVYCKTLHDDLRYQDLTLKERINGKGKHREV